MTWKVRRICKKLAIHHYGFQTACIILTINCRVIFRQIKSHCLLHQRTDFLRFLRVNNWRKKTTFKMFSDKKLSLLGRIQLSRGRMRLESVFVAYLILDLVVGKNTNYGSENNIKNLISQKMNSPVAINLF